MNKKLRNLVYWLLAPIILIAGVFANRVLVATEGDGRAQACLLVDDIAKDTWQALHYGTSQGLLNSELQLATYSFSQSWLDDENKRNPCPSNSEVIVNAWQHNKFAALGSTGRLALIGNSFDGQILKPDFNIGAYFEPSSKAKLLADFIHQHRNGREQMTVALVLGPRNIQAVQDLVRALRQAFNQYDGIIIAAVFYSNDTKFEQYLAMSQLLVDEEEVDFIVATPTAIEQASNIISGRELDRTGLISLAVSKPIVSLMEQDRILAMIDDKPILQGRWLASWLKQEKITEKPAVDFQMQILKPSQLSQVSQPNSLVPYGYRVIYNSGN